MRESPPGTRKRRTPRDPALSTRPSDDTDTTNIDRELALAEVEQLTQCENVIATGIKTFIAVGEALSEIRDDRLYRETHGTFDQYCRERWGWTASRARQLIGAAETATNVTLSGGSAPATESQARELAGLTPTQAAIVMRVAADDGLVTAASIKAARRQPWTRAEITEGIDGFGIHAAIAVFPAFRPEEWESFAVSIGEYGLIMPITLTRDGSQILDGRFRYLALRWNGIDPDAATTRDGRPAFERFGDEVATNYRGDEFDFVVSEHLFRKNLNDGQNAFLRLGIEQAVSP